MHVLFVSALNVNMAGVPVSVCLIKANFILLRDKVASVLQGRFVSEPNSRAL